MDKARFGLGISKSMAEYPCNKTVDKKIIEIILKGSMFLLRIKHHANLELESFVAKGDGAFCATVHGV